MKKIYLFFILLCFVALGFSQPPVRPEVVKDGLKVGRVFPKVILSNELKTLIGIDTTKTINEQFDETVKLTDSVAGYTAEEVDSISYIPKAVQDIKLLKGSPYTGNELFPIGYSFGTGAVKVFSDQQMYVSTFYVKKDTTIYSLSYVLSTAFVGTADNENGFALYSVGTNADPNICDSIFTLKSATMWSGTTGVRTVNLPTPITLQAGEYKLAALFNHSAQTTAPSVESCGTGRNGRSLFVTSNYISCRYNTISVLPATINLSGSSADGIIVDAWLDANSTE